MTHLECWEVWITCSKSESSTGEETEKTVSVREESSAMREADWKGDSGLSRRVAEISASMIWPGVISIGMPRSGVGGRGGVLGREIREPRLDIDTGEVGRLTVTGTLELSVRLKYKEISVKTRRKN